MSTVSFRENFPGQCRCVRDFAREVQEKAEKDELIVAQVYRTLTRTASFHGGAG